MQVAVPMFSPTFSKYLELTKPRITCFILMSAAIGFFCAAHRFGGFHAWVLFHALLGTALMASGTAALNQWYERIGDGQMLRTRNRHYRLVEAKERLDEDSDGVPDVFVN